MSWIIQVFDWVRAIPTIAIMTVTVITAIWCFYFLLVNFGIGANPIGKITEYFSQKDKLKKELEDINEIKNKLKFKEKNYEKATAKAKSKLEENKQLEKRMRADYQMIKTSIKFWENNEQNIYRGNQSYPFEMSLKLIKNSAYNDSFFKSVKFVKDYKVSEMPPVLIADIYNQLSLSFKDASPELRLYVLQTYKLRCMEKVNPITASVELERLYGNSISNTR